MEITCPTCQKLHALFYTVHKGGKKTLNYLCDRQVRAGVNRAKIPEPHQVTAVCTANFKPDLPIPERWSPGYAKEQQDLKQNQLPIMWAKPKVAE